VDVISDEGDHFWPIELVANVLDRLVIPGDQRGGGLGTSKGHLIRWPGGQAHTTAPCSKGNRCRVKVTMGWPFEH